MADLLVTGLAGALWMCFAKNPRVVVSDLSMNVRSRAVMPHVDVGQQVFRYECFGALRRCHTEPAAPSLDGGSAQRTTPQRTVSRRIVAIRSRPRSGRLSRWA